jgi:hypothetical protein
VAASWVMAACSSTVTSWAETARDFAWPGGPPAGETEDVAVNGETDSGMVCWSAYRQAFPNLQELALK